MWTLTKNQDVWAKLVPLRFLWRFWFWNPFICLGLGNHQSDPLLCSTGNIQNSSSRNQNLGFIYLVWIPSRLSSKLHQGSLFKEQMNSHKFVLSLKLDYVTTSAYHSHSVPTILTKKSHPSFSTPSNQYCFIINLKSTFSWFSRNSSHNIINFLGSKKILFPHLTASFVHKITHNKVGIVVPCILRLGWPRDLSPLHTPILNSRSPLIALRTPYSLFNFLVLQ